MRCCAFGTVRMDIHAYQDINEMDKHEEIKIDEMSMKVGGSVYNTVSVLNELKQDVILYMLNATDDFADYVKIKLNKHNVNYISCRQDKNDTATSLIFVDKLGKKRMISYDGVRQDGYILNKLMRDINQYELFYTSFYEINTNNCKDIENIMSLCAKNFVDLSPLIYEVDINVIDRVLRKIQILSGTSDEYDILLKKIGIHSYERLMEQYNFDYLFIKQGSLGATLYTKEDTYSYTPKLKKVSHDTTGCGDTFNAGVIHALAKGKNEKLMLQEAVEMATKVAYEGFDLKLFSKMQ